MAKMAIDVYADSFPVGSRIDIPFDFDSGSKYDTFHNMVELVFNNYTDLGLHFIFEASSASQAKTILGKLLAQIMAKYRKFFETSTPYLDMSDYINNRRSDANGTADSAGGSEISPVNSLISLDMDIVSPNEKRKNTASTESTVIVNDTNVSDKIRWQKFIAGYQDYYNIVDKCFRQVIDECISVM